MTTKSLYQLRSTSSAESGIVNRCATRRTERGRSNIPGKRLLSDRPHRRRCSSAFGKQFIKLAGELAELAIKVERDNCSRCHLHVAAHHLYQNPTVNEGACRKALAVKQPDILLLDLSMPDGDGIAFCREVADNYPCLPVIVLTMHDECSVVKRAMESGIKGYLLKSVSCEELTEAIERVHHGETYLCREIMSLMRKHSSGTIHLTSREREVLKLLIEGVSSEEIARQLFISPLTVKWHRRNMLAKFDVQNIGMLISKAIKERLV